MSKAEDLFLEVARGSQREKSIFCGYTHTHTHTHNDFTPTTCPLSQLVGLGGKKCDYLNTNSYYGKKKSLPVCISLRILVIGSVCSVTQLCLTLCNPMDYSPPGSSVHGIFQARIRVAISFSRGSSRPGIEPTSPASSALAGRFFTTAPPGKPSQRVGDFKIQVKNWKWVFPHREGFLLCPGLLGSCCWAV